MSVLLMILALVLAFIAGGLAATWAWSFLVLSSAHRTTKTDSTKGK